MVKILNKVHLYHNPTFFATYFTLFRWAVYHFAWTLKCVSYKKKVLTDFESSSTYSATDPGWTICILNSSTDHRCPLTLKNSTIWLRWSMFLNLWTVFTMEAIVLVSVLTSSAKIYDLGPLQDGYPARRRPTSFRYCNSVTKM